MEDCNEPGFCHWTDLSGRLMSVNEQLFVWKSVIQPSSLIAINYRYQTKELLPQTKAMINMHLLNNPQMKCSCNLQVNIYLKATLPPFGDFQNGGALQ